MENASKALLMAGGVLIALLIVTGLIVMWTQISDFYKSGSDTDKEEQLVKFNQQYATYDRDNVLGSDVITVINKANDYNKLRPVDNYVPYKKITITVNVKNGRTNFGWSYLFKQNQYIDTNLTSILQPMKALDTDPGTGVMNKLSSNKEKLERAKAISDLEYSNTMKDIIGRDISNNVTPNKIAMYREYSEFKNSKFNCTERNYDNGQITGLTFTMNK